MVIHVEELLVDFADLGLIKTKSFSGRQRFDGGKLVKQNEIVVKNAVVDGIKVLFQNLLVTLVVASLDKSHIHDTTEDLEKILNPVIHALD